MLYSSVYSLVEPKEKGTMESLGLTTLVTGVECAVRTAFCDLEKWTEVEMYSSSRFTHRVFSEFRRLAEKLNYDVRLSATEPRNYEFLYDICFLKTSGEFNDRNGYFTTAKPLQRSVLVLECEWSPIEEEIIYDFSKMLLARADLRCLIFYRNSRQLVDSFIARVKTSIAAYEQSESRDRYLLCGLYERKTTFTMLDGNGGEVTTSKGERDFGDAR
jgi:hypothetical protein